MPKKRRIIRTVAVLFVIALVSAITFDILQNNREDIKYITVYALLVVIGMLILYSTWKPAASNTKRMIIAKGSLFIATWGCLTIVFSTERKAGMHVFAIIAGIFCAWYVYVLIHELKKKN